MLEFISKKLVKKIETIIPFENPDLYKKQYFQSLLTDRVFEKTALVIPWKSSRCGNSRQNPRKKHTVFPLLKAEVKIIHTFVKISATRLLEIWP